MVKNKGAEKPPKTSQESLFRDRMGDKELALVCCSGRTDWS